MLIILQPEKEFPVFPSVPVPNPSPTDVRWFASGFCLNGHLEITGGYPKIFTRPPKSGKAMELGLDLG